jgi:hypothetical protein
MNVDVIPIGILIIYNLFFIGGSLVLFIYQYKRKFRAKLFNFKHVWGHFLFAISMALISIMMVMFLSEYFRNTRAFKDIMKTGVPTTGEAIYKNVLVYSRDISVAIAYYGPSEKKITTDIKADSLNYLAIPLEKTLRVHYRGQDPADIILADYPPRVDPVTITFSLPFLFLFITGVWMWIKRNDRCESCDHLNSHFDIRVPTDLKKVLRTIRQNVTDGKLSVLLDKTPMSKPFEKVPVDGPWYDDVEYVFRCNSCLSEFTLYGGKFGAYSKVHHSRKGRWKPI